MLWRWFCIAGKLCRGGGFHLYLGVIVLLSRRTYVDQHGHVYPNTSIFVVVDVCGLTLQVVDLVPLYILTNLSDI